MLTHLFKLIWNKKKQNALLITEMLISFFVMFAVFTMLVFSYNNYKQPIGFDYENVWVVNYTPPATNTSADSAVIFLDALKGTLLAMPQVKEVSYTGGNVPFSMNTSNTQVNYEKHNAVMSNVYGAQPDFLKVTGMKMKSGRWIAKGDEMSKVPLIVINRKLEEDLFNGKEAIGKMIGGDGAQMKVIGVTEDIKDKGSYQAVEGGYYKPIDTSWAKWMGTILLKVEPNADAVFEGKLFKTLSNAIGTSVEIEHLRKKLVEKNKVMLIPMIIGFIVAGFLIINVALGLFGVLWYNISKRKGEIGLRRAVGASGNSISKQLVGEVLVLSTISLLLGCFFAIQFPLLNVFDLPAGVYIAAIVLAVLFIYLLVALCAFYPGKQAAGILPAVALHEE